MSSIINASNLPKNPSSTRYFTQDTEDAIVEYVKTTDMVVRNKIFNERIDYAFHKLTENIIHTFKFYYTEVDTIPELQHDLRYPLPFSKNRFDLRIGIESICKF